MVVDIELVLDKVGGQDNDFVAGVQQGFQHHVQGRTGTAGHNHVGAGYRLVATLGNDFSNGGAGFIVTGIVHITMHPRQRGFGNFFQRGVQFSRWFDGRVAEGEIENLIGTVLLPQCGTFLEHFANPGSALEAFIDFRGDGHSLTSFQVQ